MQAEKLIDCCQCLHEGLLGLTHVILTSMNEVVVGWDNVVSKVLAEQLHPCSSVWVWGCQGCA